ncbi:hypothetical protein PHAVU_L002937 [Phaseolus vulgaris]|uniref:Uncharacterized protein n=2 Tax=Phaseolus vulgaris TaxID=3885 RepID=A0ACC3P206_PHAVU|nr:hypothetical protein PHAVU_006G009700g [Phaseolus vulgaris]ESW18058.1 hypothetical protein PHAVU_006G009700g [Phaseolus vulgaris]
MRSYGKEYITTSLICQFLMIVVFQMLDPLLVYVLPGNMLIHMLCVAEHLLFSGIKLFLCGGLRGRLVCRHSIYGRTCPT